MNRTICPLYRVHAGGYIMHPPLPVTVTGIVRIRLCPCHCTFIYPIIREVCVKTMRFTVSFSLLVLGSVYWILYQLDTVRATFKEERCPRSPAASSSCTGILPHNEVNREITMDPLWVSLNHCSFCCTFCISFHVSPAHGQKISRKWRQKMKAD